MAFQYGIKFFNVHRPIYDSVVEYLSNSFSDRLPAFKNEYFSSNDPEGYASIYLTDLLEEHKKSLPKPAPRSYSAAVGSAPAYLSSGRADQEQNGNWSVVGRGGRGGGGGGGSVASGGGGVLAQPDGGGGGGGSNRATARNMSKGFFSTERIASTSKDGYKVQVQINPTQAGAIIGVGGKTQQKLQRNTKTGISVLDDGFILQVQSRTGNIEDVEEALRRIGEKLTLKKNEHIRMTLRKRKNQKTRKNRR